ncbi:hypothetical protein MPHO_21390 [Mycolicibacterium phocaicum]|mgnify:CR=1 FL=1|nr:hypothetical protein MPHO_21390 [Mycolicibacterium phocaicum]
MTPIGVDLTHEQAMAAALRHLATIGFAENLAGHITFQPDGQTDMYVNPWGLWWQEVTASDICMVDEDARVQRVRWDVTPAIHIHTELHRARADARVVIHNHPYYVCCCAGPAPRPRTPDRLVVPGRPLPGRRIRRRGRQSLPRSRIGGSH